MATFYLTAAKKKINKKFATRVVLKRKGLVSKDFDKAKFILKNEVLPMYDLLTKFVIRLGSVKASLDRYCEQNDLPVEIEVVLDENKLNIEDYDFWMSIQLSISSDIDEDEKDELLDYINKTVKSNKCVMESDRSENNITIYAEEE